MIGFLIALFSGILMSIQGVFNTEVTKNSSVWVSNIWVHATALLVCLVAWFFTGRNSFEGVWATQPKYLLTGGVIGALITYTVIMSITKLGPARSALFIVSAQIIASYLIEVLGLFGTEKQEISVRSIVGLVIAVIGVAIFKW